jgi:hypothetical protein
MYSVLKTKQKKWNILAVWKLWSAPSCPEMFQGIPHKNIILGEYLHSILFWKLKKKKSSVIYFYKYFRMDLYFYAVDRPSWACKSVCSVYT